MTTAAHSENRFGQWPEDDRPRRRRMQQATRAVRDAGGALRGRRGGRGGRRRGGEQAMVPEAEFTSYYGKPVIKASPWEKDIPAYLFTGGLAGGLSLLAAGADLTGRNVLRRSGRIGALTAISASTYFLINDLGKPSRFVNMLRVFRPTSPMSMGSWLLAGYGPLAGLAAMAELVPALPAFLRGPGQLLGALGRPAGLGAAALAPGVASYTAVLLGDTATPAWHDAHRQLPFFFAGSAAGAAGGLGMLTSPTGQAGPARRMAIGGVVLEMATDQWMESEMGLSAETLHEGRAGRLLTTAKVLNAAGALGALVGGRSRVVSALSGAALLVGSACTRFGIFEAGQASARDPKYTVVPQRERLDAGQPVRAG
ncbi:MAG TPA: NrfD/PsrC family molybdoenzyme membrane anchor subunit [Segeticoccus sp.]|nr:NrfD/PsrC family molybdoenzyme membrane anchor subunit [Segeticoccus sp.]